MTKTVFGFWRIGRSACSTVVRIAVIRSVGLVLVSFRDPKDFSLREMIQRAPY
jgi:hypothetical protein